MDNHQRIVRANGVDLNLLEAGAGSRALLPSLLGQIEPDLGADDCGAINNKPVYRDRFPRLGSI
jgi:hypothetical protein